MNRTAVGGEEGGSNSRTIWIPIVLNSGKNLPVLIPALGPVLGKEVTNAATCEKMPGELWAMVLLTRASHPLAQVSPKTPHQCSGATSPLTHKGASRVTLSKFHWVGKVTFIPAAAAPTFDAVP